MNKLSVPSMKRKYLFLIAVVGGFACVGSLFLDKPVDTAPIHIENPQELVSVLPTASPLELKINAAVQEINRRNAGVKSFMSENMDVTIQRDIAVRLRGSLAYEKDRRFRLIIRRRLGTKEADIGSNNQYFWFWSRRHDPPHLFYADHKDVYKSRLKTPFHPLWMMGALSMGTIDLKGAKVSEFEGKWKVSQKRKGTLGKMIIKSTIIDPDRKVVVGHYISSLSGKLIASTEIEEWDGNTPSVIIMRWHDEGVSIRLKFIHPKVNPQIDEDYWKLPNIRPKQNMAEN